MHIVVCAFCGKEFATSHSQKKCCSDSCSHEYRKRRSYDYWASHKEDSKARYEANKDTIVARQLSYDRKHRKKRRKYQKKYYYSEKGLAARNRAKEKRLLIHPLKGRKPAMPKEEARKRKSLRKKEYLARGKHDFLHNVVSRESITFMHHLDYQLEWKLKHKDRVHELHMRDSAKEKLRDVASMWMRVGVVS